MASKAAKIDNEAITKFEPYPVIISSNRQIILQMFAPRAIPSVLNEEIFVEGFSEKSNSKTTYFSITVKGIVINPCLSWNRDHINFEIMYGDDYLSKCCEKLAVENCGILPMEIFCKTEENFSLRFLNSLEDQNELNFCLYPKSIKEILVVFNVSVIEMYNKTINFTGKIKTKVCEKIQPSVQLLLSVRYPFIEVSKSFIKLIGDSVNIFEILNIEKLSASYKWSLRKNSFYSVSITDTAISNVTNLSEDFFANSTSSYGMYEEKYTLTTENIEESDYDSEVDDSIIKK